jgi:hypothetical protein
MESYTTPIPFDDKLIVVGGDYVTKMTGPQEHPCRSSIVAAHGSLFIRTGKNLYCITQK